MMPCTVSGTSASVASSRHVVAVAAEQATILQHPDVLLGEERVALRAPEQRLLHLRRQHRL